MTFPRIAIDVLLDLPSVDSSTVYSDPFSETVRQVLKLKDSELDYNYELDEQYDLADWTARWWDHGQELPVHVYTARAGDQQYGAAVPSHLDGKLVMGNGHHRVAFAIRMGETHVLFSPHYDDTYGLEG